MHPVKLLEGMQHTSRRMLTNSRVCRCTRRVISMDHSLGPIAMSPPQAPQKDQGEPDQIDLSQGLKWADSRPTDIARVST